MASSTRLRAPIFVMMLAMCVFGLGVFPGEALRASAQDAAGDVQQESPESPTKKVLLIGIDGCRFDAMHTSFPSEVPIDLTGWRASDVPRLNRGNPCSFASDRLRVP